ncbi:hypothetical protein [Algoriphagus marinus]|uniref:hypothetical protein n=1 Tax=Algoriphagus marinus TaxID=1925762 RepID=UPI00094BC34A|nr:hypothetical protein [Algoriphagus marinus]
MSLFQHKTYLTKKTEILFFILSLVFCLTVHKSNAQDTHHWNNQFGTRAALLGGAVLTDTIDNAGVYYNPGNLAYLDTTTLSINANLYGIENIKVQNALGQKADFKGVQFNTIPLLISGSIRNKSKWNISYGLLTPVSFKFNGNARIVGDFDLIEEAESPGKEELVAESSINTTVQETALTLGIGRKIKPNLGFGLSLINTFRSVNYDYRFSARTLLINPTTELLVGRNQNEFVNYYNVRTALKMGFNYQKPGFGLGLTLMSPGIRLMGSGTVAGDLTLSNIQFGENRLSAFASDRQEKLKSNYKSPFEIGLGFHKQISQSIISLNVTHFGGFDPYLIIKAEPGVFVRPSNIGEDLGSEKFLNLETGMKSVTNFSIGYQTKIKTNVSLMGSFRSDFSYFDSSSLEAQQLTTEFSQWDIYHLSIGTIINQERSSLTLGLIYSFGGTDEFVQDNSFNDVEINNPLTGSLKIIQANYFNIGILVGYSFRFKKFNFN